MLVKLSMVPVMIGLRASSTLILLSITEALLRSLILVLKKIE